jgi:BolA protein
MNQLLELSPLIVFFAVFEWAGIYAATAALMIACVLLMLVHRLQTGKFKTMHVITVVVVLTLGAATLLLHDRRFIQWKPTVLLGLTAIAFFGSMFIGKQPLVRRMFGAAFDETLQISARQWLLINSLWLVCGPGGGEHLRGAELCREHVGPLQGDRHSRGDVPVHAAPGTLAGQQDQNGATGPRHMTPPAGQDGRESTGSRAERLRRRLQSRLSPTLLTIEDESHLHAGHAGAAGGHSHFRVTIVAEAFRGIAPVARHRLVYAAVDDLMKTDIHALAIEASPPP